MDTPEIIRDTPLPTRPPREFKAADHITIPLIYLLSVGFIYAALEGAPVGMWLALTILLIGTPFYLRRFDIHPSLPAYGLFVLLPIFALPQIISDNAAVHSLSMATCLLGYMYAVHYACAEFGRDRLPGEVLFLDTGKAILGMPFCEIDVVPAMLMQCRGKRVVRTIGFILCGLLLALIPTLVVLVLLVNADRGFENLIGRILDNLLYPDSEITAILLVSLFFAIPVCCYLAGHLRACGTHAMDGGVKRETADAATRACRFMPATMTCATVAPMLIVYLLFFSTQIPYFIGGFTGTLPDGLTYSAYARKGFFELCTVAVINAFILFCLNLFTRRKTDRLPIIPRIMSLLLSLSTLILLSTAIAKMLLYIDTYGLSRKRIYTLWLMAFLAVYFTIKIIVLFVPKLRAAALIFAVALLFVGIFLFADFDAIIADYNVDAYLSGEHQSIDIPMLGDLSASAIPHLIRLYDSIDDPDGRYAIDVKLAEFCQRTQGDVMEAYGYGGWNFNLTRAHALKLVRTHETYS